MKSTTAMQLIEAAGAIFAERGFEAATGKDICERAGLAPAAINYHFGGMQGLYEATLIEARARLMDLGAVMRGVSAAGSPEDMLRRLIDGLAAAILGSDSSSWMVRLLGREITASYHRLPMMEEETRRRAGILTEMVAAVMKLPADHPAVARSCISVMAPVIVLLVANRSKLEGAFPYLRLDDMSPATLGRHLSSFALAGLKAIAEE